MTDTQDVSTPDRSWMDDESFDSDTTDWTDNQLNTIVLFERLGAALSVVGVLLIFLAFVAFKRLRTVPNTFIVFASIANLGASTACLIGYSGVLQGPTSHLCQAQAFLFELFMQSDPWWSFAMAVNVYMVFFLAANPKNFLHYWWAYFLVCYGIPFIPALWLLLIRDGEGQTVYGDATIWCWIDQEWSDLRIYTYYLPIWVCIILSTCIYVAVGYYVFKQRNQLRNLSLTSPSHDSPTTRDSGEKNLFADAAVMGTINREVVQVTTVNSTIEHDSGTAAISPIDPGASGRNWFDDHPSGPAPLSNGSSSHVASPTPYYQTTVTRITADPVPKEGVYVRIRRNWERWCGKFENMDPVKLAYLRTSFVFAISVFVTWTPSSINRVHDLIYKGNASFGLNLASAIVLPLQGVWNAVIFFSTSWVALREEVRARADYHCHGVPRGYRTANAVRDERERERTVELQRRTGGPGSRDDDSESELSAATTLGGCNAGGNRSGSSASNSTMRVLRGGSLTTL